MTVAIVVLVRNEAPAIPGLARRLASLRPPADEVVVVDGGGADGSAESAEALGLRVVRCPAPGRGAAINAGVSACSSRIVCVLHADTVLPSDAVAVIRRTMEDGSVSLAGFTAVIRGERLRWATTAHNWAKTWYGPLLARPDLFRRGGRLLFGDHAMFFRRDEFIAVGGCDESLAIMEDADLCVRMTRLGRVRLLRRTVRTSDRRIARWGPLRANWIYMSVSLRWAIGRRDLAHRYPDVR